MDRPAKTPALVQPSIRSFFQPRQPTYAKPPANPTTADAPPDQGGASNSNDKTTSTEPPPASIIPQPPPLPPQPGSAPPPVSTPQAPPSSLPYIPSLPVLPPAPSLPTNATIAPITAEHIPALRRINSLLLQISYPDSFYTTILTAPTSPLFSRAILWSESSATAPTVVGSVVCRLETPANPSEPSAIYIQSLTLLSPYRSLGLAAAALEHVISTAALLNLDAAAGVDIRTVYAHVWTENEEGLRWYTSRGFKKAGKLPVAGYYFRLRPDTAWVVSRAIGDMAGPAQQQNDGEKDVNGGDVADEQRGRGSVLAGAVNLPGFAVVTGGAEGNGVGSKVGERKLTQRPSPAPSLSYQKTRPDTEWNDLPADMVAGSNGAAAAGTARSASQHLSAPASGTSSRSSSSGRRKKERAYPAAAFGS